MLSNFFFPSVSEEHSVLLARRFLVLINPMAGAQNGKSLFEKYVKKMFDLAEIQYFVEYTGKVLDTILLPLLAMIAVEPLKM